MNNQQEDIFKGYGIKISLNEDFVKIREVLTRIGIANRATKTLTQSCHIFHKRGEYAIMHFKEMFLFDGKSADFTEEDEARRNLIVKILQQWGLITIDDDISDHSEFPVADFSAISIINRKMKNEENWNLIKKYTLGRG